MAGLSFLDQLDDEQLKYARIIGERAKAINVDPALAISIAYQESRLRPSVGDSSKGAVGIMQVMPATAANLNVGAEALRDVEANINVGLKVLKLALAEAQQDPVKAAIVYNAGGGRLKDFEAGKGLPDETKRYIGELYASGAFKDKPVPEGITPPPQEEFQEPAEAPPERGPVGQALDFLGKASEELGPGGLGATAGAVMGVGEKLGMGPAAIAEQFTKAMQPPGAPAGGSPGAPPGMPAGAPPGAAPGVTPAQQATRILQGTTGDMGTTGRQRQMGYNEPTSQTAARREMIAKDLGKIGLDPQRVFAEAADVTATPSGVLYPRGVVPPDLTPPVPPPKVSPLEQAKQLVQGVMERGSQISRGLTGVAKAMPMVSYPLAGYSIGSDIGQMREQMSKPKPDYTDIGLLGAGALGTLGSFSTALSPVAVPLAIGAPAIRYMRSRLAPNEPVTPEEEQQAGRAAFGVFPSMR